MNGFVKVLAAAAFGSAAMFGNTLTTTITNLTAPNGNQAPYLATVGGVSNTQVICDDDYDSYQSGVTYDIQTLSQIDNGGYATTLYGGLPGMTQSIATKLYDEVAFLALQFAGNSSNLSAIQGAIWDLFYQVAAANGVTNNLNSGKIPISLGTPCPTTSKSSVCYWYDLAETQTTVTATSAIDKSIEFLTPLCNGKTCTAGQPASSQEFLVFTPEPATYALFGMGLILLSVGTFRRRKNKTN